MNEDLYLKAEKVITNSNLWIDDKTLLKTIISRARRLEQEAIRKQEEIDELHTIRTFKEEYDKCNAIDISEVKEWEGYKPID